MKKFLAFFMAALMTVSYTHLEDKASARFAGVNKELADCSLKAVFYSSLTNPSTRFVNNIIYAVVALVGTFIILSGGLTVGGLSVLLSYANQYMKPVSYTHLLAAIRLVPLFDLPEISVFMGTFASIVKISVYLTCLMYTLRNAFGTSYRHRTVCGLFAVSYTHLDVYKRQVQRVATLWCTFGTFRTSEKYVYRPLEPLPKAFAKKIRRLPGSPCRVCHSRFA